MSVKNSPKEKLFIIKKYVMARNAHEALRKEKNIKPDDCWVDDDWRKEKQDRLADALGFKVAE